MNPDQASRSRPPEGDDTPLRGFAEISDAPAHLEERVVARLREQNLLRTSPVRGTHRTRAAIAASILLAFLLGLLVRRPPSAPLANYLLLLDGAPGEALSIAQTEDRIAEYGAWARRLEDDGLLVTAERLLPEADSFGPGSPMASPSGFFLIRARDRAHARAAAGDCPHLRHGGSVSLQAIDVPQQAPLD